MKKHISLVLLIVLIGIFAFSVSASAAEMGLPCFPTWSFDEATGTITVYGNGYMTFLSPPEWSYLKDRITKVVISEGLVSVGPNAFSSCKNLKSVTLASSVAHINDYAFRDCVSLTDIDLKYITSIGTGAFRNCTGLTALTIPDGVSDIGDYAFYACTGLRSVTFHDKLFGIGDAAFSGCTGLTSVTIPDSVEIICDSAFSRCTNLTQIKLGSGLTILETRAFRDCTGLKSITIPDKVSLIDSYTFEDCLGLEEITFGTGVTTFNAYALKDCSNLKKVFFLGKPPKFQSKAFLDLTVTICYFGGISEWETVSLPAGNLTFTPVYCENHTVTPLATRTPTCTQEGLTAGSSCSVCKKTLTPQQPIPKVPHAYGDWQINHAPETNKKYPKKRICSVCGYVEYAEANQTQAPSPQPSVPADPVASAPVESTPTPTLPEQSETELPTQNTAGSEIPTTPVIPNTPKDTGGKNTLIFVGVGIILLGVVAGIIFITPRLTQKKEK